MKTNLLLLLLLILMGWQPLYAQTLPSGFSSVTVAAGWDEAVGITFNKAGTQLFVWERPGRVWVMENGQRSLLLDIREEVGGWRDYGLLGFALHPQFDTNGYFYLFYTVDRHHLMNFGTSNYSSTTDDYFSATINRLTRFTATKSTTGYTVNAASRKVLLGATRQTGVPILHQSHGPGSLVFGTDGTLLVSTGDGASYDNDDVGSASETYYTQALTDGIIPAQQNVGALRAQQLESYNGKVLRLDPETGNGILSNPFYQSTTPASVQSKVWALGLRNPFRMSLRPGSGSTLPGDGRPGVLYIGDVGYNTWEELNIATKPGMNFGWPLFEGLTTQEGYWSKQIYNQYAPNPAYGTKGCTQQYFYFQDLIKQQTASGTTTYLNPCTGQGIPTTVRTFMHSRPVIDWKHQEGGPSRTGTFSGETATIVNLNDPASPVSGSLFSGGSVIAGAFYTANDYPPEYRNTCFFGDYVGGFIRHLSVDAADKPLAVKDFINNSAVVVSMAAHPTDGSLYYLSFYPSEIRKILYRAPDRAPIAVASADKTYGLGPLTVQFTGDKSYDPDGRSLTYLWNFGDGTTSTAANPTHTYATGSPINYTVTLTVRDNSLSGQTSLVISANNTPPQVSITSPAEGTKYPMDKETIYPLKATVTDPQHISNQLTYAWQTTLYHDDHNHPEPVDTNPETTTRITPLGCGTETYSYRISLTVTDALGLATKQEVTLYPDCGSAPPTSAVYRINAGGPAVSPFAADQYFTSTGGGIYTSQNPISGTTNPAIYQSERWGMKELSYNFPVANGQYTVVLHFAEVAFTAVGQRVFDVLLENQKVLTNYDIVKKVGPNAATSETFPVSVSDGVLNVYLTSLNPGNIENPKISAIEILSATTTNQPPTVAAGTDKSITLPTNSVTLVGSASDPENALSGYRWTQASGPNTAILSGASTATLTASELIAGIYTFRLTVTDNGGATAFDEATVTVNPATPAPSGSAVYRINAGGPAVSPFAADQYFLPGSGGGSYTVANQISGTTNPAIYQSERWGMKELDYAFPVTNGQYTVVLHFAEIAFTAVGQRVFNVLLENQKALTNYDIVKKVGPNTATTETFAVSVGDGTLNLHLTSLNPGNIENPKISAIEVLSNSSTNLPPSANAGTDKVITLPTNSVTLNGQGTDTDGTISSYNWTQVSGPTATLSGTTIPNLSVSSMVAGSYTFRLTVTDNVGASAFDEVSVTVNPASTPTNQPPTVSAGSDKTITLPTNSVSLTGAASDPDGTISIYSWTKTNGPTATLSGATSANLTASNLVEGSYVFRFTVTDNGGASTFDEVNIKVNPAPTGPRVVSFTLINKTNGQESPLEENGVIDLTKGNNFNIRANPGPSTVSRIDFTLSGTERRTNSDRSAPFTLVVESVNTVWRPLVGSYSLSAKPFATNGNGSAGPASSINFRVTNGSALAATTGPTSAVTLVGKSPSETERVSYYPNPFTKQFTLELPAKGAPQIPVRLYNMLGQEVEARDNAGAGQTIYMGEHLPAGIYTLKVGLGNRAQYYRLIKAN